MELGKQVYELRNIYPENITQYIDTPISWKAYFGKEYVITITGDKANGYKAVLN